MTVYYMSFVKDGAFAGVSLVHGDSPEEAVQAAWEHDCNPGGEIMIVAPECIPDDKWFYRILDLNDLREMESEVNLKYHRDSPRLTPRLYQ